jgi:dTDP-4-dehydrorhamnose 3,5-epimerase
MGIFMPFKFKKLNIPGLILIEPQVFEDERGFFLETYKEKDFKKNGIKEKFLQENHSKSKKGVLRGLHFQKEPFAQGKLIRVIRGEIFDVAVDIRKRSKTYGKWLGINLSDKNKKMLYIPPGFAHGFCVLSNFAEVVYKCTKPYSLKHEGGIRWDDKALNIKWPVKNPIVSKKDLKWPPFKDLKNNY